MAGVPLAVCGSRGMWWRWSSGRGVGQLTSRPSFHIFITKFVFKICGGGHGVGIGWDVWRHDGDDVVVVAACGRID